MSTFADLAAEGTIFYSDGYRTKQMELAENGYRILRVADVHHGWVSLDGTDHIDTAFEVQIGKKAARDGDVLLTTKGTIGRVAVVSGLENQKVAYSPQLCFFRVLRGNTLDPRFLRYWFSSPDARRQIKNYSGNTDMAPYLNLRDIGAVNISLPEMHDQQAIAEVLGALDDKVASNRRVVAALDKLGRLIARRETAEGIGHALMSVAELVTRGVAPKYSDAGYLVLNQKCVRNNRVDVSLGRTMSALPKAQEKVLRSGDILVNSTGQGTLGRVARWTRGDQAVSVDSHISIVRIDSSIADRHYVGTLMLDREADIEALAEGTTGQTELRREVLGSLPLRLPSLDVQRRVGEHLRSMASVMDARDIENVRLAATRDELLPLLMSGRIAVKDAERRVEQEV